MDVADIIEELGSHPLLPREAMLAASERREACLPVFIEAVERTISGDSSETLDRSIIFIFHLFGEWRETRAYPALVRLLRLPRERLENLLGDAITESTPRVMQAVFDGDTKPLHEAILDSKADEYARSRLLETLAIVTHDGRVPLEETRVFLKRCFEELDPEPNMVWYGWQSAVAMLGLEELAPSVKQAFKKGSVESFMLDLSDFEEDLAHALESPGVLIRDPEYDPIEDAVEELSQWACFREGDPADETAMTRIRSTACSRMRGQGPSSIRTGTSAATIRAHAGAGRSTRSAASKRTPPNGGATSRRPVRGTRTLHRARVLGGGRHSFEVEYALPFKPRRSPWATVT